MDRHPGDRLAECRGMMEPVAIEEKGGEQKLTHRCVRCGYERKNKVSPKDDFSALLRLAEEIASKR